MLSIVTIQPSPCHHCTIFTNNGNAIIMKAKSTNIEVNGKNGCRLQIYSRLDSSGSFS